jgi:hypothetical protein
MNSIQIPIVIKYIFAWFALPFIAIFNGILRELTYSHMVGEHVAQQISSVILTLIIAFYVIALNSKLSLKNTQQAFAVGLIWLFFTLVFETLLSFILGIPFRIQLESYNLLKGNLWVLVLLTTLLSPMILRRHKALTHAG